MKKLILTSVIAFGAFGAANAAVTSPQLWPALAAHDFGFVETLTGGAVDRNTAYDTVAPYVDEINAGLADYTDQINSEFTNINGQIAGINAQIAGLSASNASAAGFASINKQLSDMNDDLTDKVNSGVATANAFSGLDNHLDNGKKYGFGVGAGYYESTGGFAVGGVVRTSDASALNAGVAISTMGDFAAKAGWNMQF